MGNEAWSNNRPIDDFEVRLMTYDDIEQVSDIEKVSFAQPWSTYAFRSELEDNELAFYCVVVPKDDPQKVIGYGGLWIILDEAHITNIAISPHYRGRGLGQLLMEDMQALARLKGAVRITLEVRVSNKRALNLYHRLGFKEEGLRKGYYTDNNEDALIMWCDLKRNEAESDE